MRYTSYQTILQCAAEEFSELKLTIDVTTVYFTHRNGILGSADLIHSKRVGNLPVVGSFFGTSKLFDTHGELDTPVQSFSKNSSTNIFMVVCSTRERLNGGCCDGFITLALVNCYMRCILESN